MICIANHTQCELLAELGWGKICMKIVSSCLVYVMQKRLMLKKKGTFSSNISSNQAFLNSGRTSIKCGTWHQVLLELQDTTEKRKQKGGNGCSYGSFGT